jgi:hypothetical protein
MQYIPSELILRLLSILGADLVNSMFFRGSGGSSLSFLKMAKDFLDRDKKQEAQDILEANKFGLGKADELIYTKDLLWLFSMIDGTDLTQEGYRNFLVWANKSLNDPQVKKDWRIGYTNEADEDARRTMLYRLALIPTDDIRNNIIKQSGWKDDSLWDKANKYFAGSKNKLDASVATFKANANRSVWDDPGGGANFGRKLWNFFKAFF